MTEIIKKDNVVGLRGQEVSHPGVPLPEVVAKAEWLLEACKSGEVNGLAYVIHFSDDGVGDKHIGLISYSMIGHWENLKKKMLKALE